MKEFDEVNKKSNAGLIVLVIFLIILLLGSYGGGYYLWDNMKKESDSLSAKLEKAESELSEVKDLKDSIKYIDFDDGYKVYALKQHHSNTASMIVGYKGSIYKVTGDNLTFGALQISKVKFDDQGMYEEKGENFDLFDYIYKFKGKESDLAKATFAVPYNSMDGSYSPILIYKDGSVEASDYIEEALKDYKIKDFISDEIECVGGLDDNMSCPKGKITFKVILQDGTEKTITY